jgi:hypothetical protein
MNSTQDYENLIELLKITLEFYANKKNYEKIIYSELRGNISSIDLDEYGSQARFALNKIKEIREINEKLVKDYSAEIEAVQNKGEQEIINTIGILKKMSNGNNNL